MGREASGNQVVRFLPFFSRHFCFSSDIQVVISFIHRSINPLRIRSSFLIGRFEFETESQERVSGLDYTTVRLPHASPCQVGSDGTMNDH